MTYDVTVPELKYQLWHEGNWYESYSVPVGAVYESFGIHVLSRTKLEFSLENVIVYELEWLHHAVSNQVSLPYLRFTKLCNQAIESCGIFQNGVNKFEETCSAPAETVLTCSDNDFIAAVTQCTSEIMDRTPFHSCVGTNSEDAWLTSCANAVCHSENTQDTLCDYATMYAELCRTSNQLLDWRTSDFCGITCNDENEEYLACGPTCVKTASNCLYECVELDQCQQSGCYCKSGYTWINNRCELDENVVCGIQEQNTTVVEDLTSCRQMTNINNFDSVLQFDGRYVNQPCGSQILLSSSAICSDSSLAEFTIQSQRYYNNELILYIEYNGVNITLVPRQNMLVEAAEDALVSASPALEYGYTNAGITITGSGANGYTVLLGSVISGPFQGTAPLIALEYTPTNIHISLSCELEQKLCSGNFLGNFNYIQSDDYEDHSTCTETIDPVCFSSDGIVSNTNSVSFDGSENTISGACEFTISELCQSISATSDMPFYKVVAITAVEEEVTIIKAFELHYRSPAKVSDTLTIRYDTMRSEGNLLASLNGGSFSKFDTGDYEESRLRYETCLGRDILFLNVQNLEGFSTWLNNPATPENYSVKITFSGQTATVHVACEYEGNTCGLFGNNDDNADTISLADVSSECGGTVSPTIDPVTETCNLNNNPDCDFANLDLQGFSECELSSIDLAFLQNNCLRDACDGRDTCSHKVAYVQLCQSQGFEVFGDWRQNNTICPLSCGENQVYKTCGNNCRVKDFTNCQDYDSTCEDPTCVAGCFCKDDYIWTGDRCISDIHCPAVPKPVNPKPPICQGTASGSGDVHYLSFDGTWSDYQGHCQYQLSKVCNDTDITEATPFFMLKARQQRIMEWFIPYVTWMHGWEFIYQPPFSNQTVTIRQDLEENNGVPRIKIDDNNFIDLQSPYVYADYGIVTVGASAQDIYFGVEDIESAVPEIYKIHFNQKQFFFQLTLDCEYKNKVCGILGDFDDDPENDWQYPNGTVIEIPPGSRDISNSVRWKTQFDFGNSWLVDQDFCPADHEFYDVTSGCTPEQKAIVEQKCSIIEEKPFSDCVTDLETTMFGCVFDLCAFEEPKWDEILCHFLEFVDNQCRTAGFDLANWRRQHEICPVQCPVNSAFSEEASPCVHNVINCRDENFICDKPGIVSRCVCSEAAPIWNGFTCVEDCPLIPPVVDPPTEELCYSHSALVGGDQFWYPFDGGVVQLHGTCEYIASQHNDSTSGLPFYQVLIKSDTETANDVEDDSFVSGVTVNYKPTSNSELYRFYIGTKFNSVEFGVGTDDFNHIAMDSVEANYNFEAINAATRRLSERQISLFLGVGLHGDSTWKSSFFSSVPDFAVEITFTTTPAGLCTLSSNGQNPYVQIRLSCDYKDSVNGVLGNYNLRTTDDLRPKEPILEDQGSSVIQWREEQENLWKTNPSCSSFVNQTDPEPCENFNDIKTQCEFLYSGAFANCRVPRDSLVKACVSHVCKRESLSIENVLCDTAEQFVNLCNERDNDYDRITSWRTAEFCPLDCGENMVYKNCTNPACHPTSADCDVSRVDCDNGSVCVDGCFCDTGYFMTSYGECVDLSECDSYLGNHQPSMSCRSKRAFTAREVFLKFDGSVNYFNQSCENIVLLESKPDVATDFIIQLTWNIKTREFQLNLDSNSKPDLLIRSKWGVHFDVPTDWTDVLSTNYNETGEFMFNLNLADDFFFTFNVFTREISVQASCVYAESFVGELTDFSEDTCSLGPACENESETCALTHELLFSNVTCFYESQFVSACKSLTCQEEDHLCPLLNQYTLPAADSFHIDNFNFQKDLYCETYNPCRENATFTSQGKHDSCLVTEDNCFMYPVGSNLVPICNENTVYEGCFCNEGYFLSSEGNCVDMSQCSTPSTTYIMNIEEPCCESDSLPSTEGPEFTNVVFNLIDDATINFNVEKPCCESESLPSVNGPQYSNLILNIKDDKIITLNVEKPCCESENLPSVDGPQYSNMKFNITKEIILNFEKPCCESDDLPSTEKPEYSNVQFEITKNITLDVVKPCCEATAVPSTEKPSYTNIEIEVTKEITLDFEKPCCESSVLPSTVEPSVSNVAFEIVKEIKLDVEKPCCESKFLPSNEKPSFQKVNINYVPKEVRLDVEKPCCESDRLPSNEAPSVSNMDIQFVFEMSMNVEKPCCESDVLPSERKPDNRRVDLNILRSMRLDVEKPCCESSSLPSTDKPLYSEINIEKLYEYTLDVGKPCCETSKLPSTDAPSYLDMHLEINSNFTLDVEKPCCESGLLPSQSSPSIANLDFDIYYDFALDIEKPCCESTSLPSTTSPTTSILSFEYMEFELDVAKPCCESTNLPASISQESIDGGALRMLDFNFDYSEEMAGITQSSPCCEDTVSSSDPCVNYKTLYNKFFENLSEIESWCNETQVQSRRKRHTTSWSDCSKSCGGGTQERIVDGALQQRTCNDNKCLGWSHWTKFTKCQVDDTGHAFQVRYRFCLGKSEDCVGENTEVLHNCAFMKPWSEWTECTAETVHRFRTRLGVNTEDKVEVRLCSKKDQKSRTKSWSESLKSIFSDEWSKCSVSCGVGVQSKRQFLSSDIITRKCYEQPCPSYVAPLVQKRRDHIGGVIDDFDFRFGNFTYEQARHDCDLSDVISPSVVARAVNECKLKIF